MEDSMAEVQDRFLNISNAIDSLNIQMRELRRLRERVWKAQLRLTNRGARGKHEKHSTRVEAYPAFRR
jgi:hypothetical protein